MPSLDEFKKKELIVRLRRMETLIDEQESKPRPKRTSGPKSKQKERLAEKAEEPDEDEEFRRLIEDPVRRKVLRADLDRSKTRSRTGKPTRQLASKNGKLTVKTIFSDDSADEEDEPEAVEISDTEKDNASGPSKYVLFTLST